MGKSVREREKHAARRRDRRAVHRRYAAGKPYEPIVTWDADALEWRYNPQPVRVFVDLAIMFTDNASKAIAQAQSQARQLFGQAATEATMDGDVPDPFTAPPDPDPHAWRPLAADPFDPDAEDAHRFAELAHMHQIPATLTRRARASEELRAAFARFGLLSLPELSRYTTLYEWEIPYFMADLEREGFVTPMRQMDEPTWLHVVND